MKWKVDPIHGWLDRMLSVGYGVVSDYVYPRFSYYQPAPDRLLREAHRVLKPGGHAVFVNHTRQIGQWSTLREIGRRDGLSAALHCLLWVPPQLDLRGGPRADRAALLGRGHVFGPGATGRVRGAGHAEDVPRRRQPLGVGAEGRRDVSEP